MGFLTEYYYGRVLTFMETWYRMPKSWVPMLAAPFVVLSWMVPSFIATDILLAVIPRDTPIIVASRALVLGMVLMLLNAIFAAYAIFLLQWREYNDPDAATPDDTE